MEEGQLVEQFVDFSQKTVLITGAGSGIGRATAEMFAKYGASVWLLDIDPKGLVETFNLLSNPENHRQFTVDLSKKENIDRFWGNLEDCPDILVNNAGFYPTQDFSKLTEAGYQKTIDVNLNSVVWMCQQFINCRQELGGAIVNVASIEAILPFKDNLAPYSVSKSGVVALTRSLAHEYGKKGFNVNAVLPGAIKTTGTLSQIVHGIFHPRISLIRTAIDFQHRLALGRWGRPEEVASVILFLASDKASYIQGALIPVDGGFLAS